MVRTPLRGLGKHGLYGNGRILNTRLRNAMGQSDMHVKRHRIGLAVSKHSRRLKCAERASVRHTDACHSQGAQGTDKEPPKLAHVRQPMTEVMNPASGFLARSKQGTRPMPAWLFGGTRQRRKQFCASGWEETKEGAAVWWRSPDDRTWL